MARFSAVRIESKMPSRRRVALYGIYRATQSWRSNDANLALLKHPFRERSHFFFVLNIENNLLHFLSMLCVEIFRELRAYAGRINACARGASHDGIKQVELGLERRALQYIEPAHPVDVTNSFQ